MGFFWTPFFEPRPLLLTLWSLGWLLAFGLACHRILFLSFFRSNYAPVGCTQSQVMRSTYPHRKNLTLQQLFLMNEMNRTHLLPFFEPQAPVVDVITTLFGYMPLIAYSDPHNLLMRAFHYLENILPQHNLNMVPRILA
uniref:Uncharacterized protein n=1 Tax=Phlegmariurus squarrosus TaxID=73615 RepID=H9M875_PHLSQ|nr:hypothetical protein HusqMp100 [Phlegmariurus squarrosus]AEV55782.1 hypothetical protein HusqMp100 [Phlegmariurus squarrosus]